ILVCWRNIEVAKHFTKNGKKTSTLTSLGTFTITDRIHLALIIWELMMPVVYNTVSIILIDILVDFIA
uniref:Uncharacterized protein n=1 Tax=Romanomermis culicivorax TaxID=13658 RepID=A0A915JBD0_ROMCU